MSYLEITGLGDLASRYRCLFVDAYGVLYDGAAPFPGVADALRSARASGLKVCIVTNSASRVDVVARRLGERAGVTGEHYDAIVTSGELSWHYLEDGGLPRGVPVYVITEEGGPAWIASINQQVAKDIRQAQAILAVGIPYYTEAEFYASDFAQTLQLAARLDLPMIVADSDETYPWRGVIRLGAGWIARLYRAMGGRLVEFGKPHRPIYAAAASALGGPAADEVLAVGDNLLTDIAGAAAFGIDSLLVLEGGVHGGLSPGALRRRPGPAPTYIANRLSW